MSMELVLMEQRDKAREEVERLTNERDEWKKAAFEITQQANKTRDELTAERDKASAEVEQWKWDYNRLSELCRSKVEQVTKDHDAARAEMERLKRELEQAIAERTPHDYGLQKCEIENLKQSLHDARLENSGQAALIEQLKEKVDQLQYIADFDRRHFLKHPEPSRLEIAAMFKAAWLSNADYKSEDACDDGWWIEQADALIAAAKGGAK